MPKRLTKETLDPARDPSGVNKDRAHGGRSDDTKVDAIRTISTGWRSASILHDLRNPLGARPRNRYHRKVFAGALKQDDPIMFYGQELPSLLSG